jgi:hypothetical protein
LAKHDDDFEVSNQYIDYFHPGAETCYRTKKTFWKPMARQALLSFVSENNDVLPFISIKKASEILGLPIPSMEDTIESLVNSYKKFNKFLF